MGAKLYLEQCNVPCTVCPQGIKNLFKNFHIWKFLNLQTVTYYGYFCYSDQQFYHLEYGILVNVHVPTTDWHKWESAKFALFFDITTEFYVSCMLLPLYVLLILSRVYTIREYQHTRQYLDKHLALHLSLYRQNLCTQDMQDQIRSNQRKSEEGGREIERIAVTYILHM